MAQDINNNLQWRSWCRTASYPNMVLVCLGLPGSIIYFMTCVNSGSESENAEEETHGKINAASKVAYIILIAVLVLISDSTIVAALNLTKSTALGIDLNSALRMSQMWAHSNLVLIMLTLLSLFITGCYTVGAAILGWLVCLYFVAEQYIRELQFAAVARFRAELMGERVRGY